MAKHNPANERSKRDYLRHLKHARGRDEATLDRVAASIERFDAANGRKAFRQFHREQAIAFRRRLEKAVNARTGAPLSKATMLPVLRDLKAFFEWLSREPGFRSRIVLSDADYFSLADKDVAIARARREKSVPTLEQVAAVVQAMPRATVLERRDRALIAFTAITAARVSALSSFQLRHVNLAEGYVDQDAREVRTKFGKTFRTWFMPGCDGAMDVVTDWIGELERDHLRGPGDPLFPATAMGLGEHGGFQPQGLARYGWASTGPVRDAFRRGFAAADLPYFNPHSFRDMLVRHAMKLDLPMEEMKAWSQNLGHKELLTTLTSYGAVPAHRQGELIRAAGQAKAGDDWMQDSDVQAMLKAIAAKARASG
jgi:integrase